MESLTATSEVEFGSDRNYPQPNSSYLVEAWDLNAIGVVNAPTVDATATRIVPALIIMGLLNELRMNTHLPLPPGRHNKQQAGNGIKITTK